MTQNITIKGKILNDLIIGEDKKDLLVVNSDTIFTGTLTANGGLVGGGGGGISNNRIDGDLTIGEDNSELLIINSSTRFNNNIIKNHNSLNNF